MKSRVHPKYKTKYRVANWAAYDRALVRRGDVTIWFSADAVATWEPAGVGKRGGQWKYSDLAIETALTLKLIFHLPLRQAEGFLTSLVGLMGLELAAPDHTTLSRRGRAGRHRSPGKITPADFLAPAHALLLRTHGHWKRARVTPWFQGNISDTSPLAVR